MADVNEAAKREAMRQIDDILDNCADIEAAHGLADEVLCSLLTELGYAEVVEQWELVPKWYA